MRERSAGPRQPDVRFEELGPSFDSARLDRFYRDVLQPSFPPDELEPLSFMEAALRAEGGSRARAIVAVAEDGDVLGGVVGYLFDRSQVLLLGYIAVRPDARRRGIGVSLLEQARDRWYGDPRCKLAIGEIEDPRHYAGRDSAARMSLYRHFGFQVLQAPYFQPRVAPDADRVYHMLLMVLHAVPSIHVESNGHQALSAEVLRSFLDEYFEDAEGIDATAADAEIRWLRRFYEGPNVLLLALDEYDRVPDLAPPAH